MSEELTQHLPSDGLRLILARLDSIDSRLGNIENRLTNVESRLDNVENRLTTVENRLDALEDKVERRLQETRPIWEGVLEQLREMNARLDRIEKDSRETRRMFRREFGELARVQDDLEERIETLEGRGP